MRATSAPWQLLSVIFAAILNEHQQRVIEYLKAENQILREQIGTKRVQLNDLDRHRLAVLGEAVGRKKLSEIYAIATPDTILRWHRTLVARKYDGSKSRRAGRPGFMPAIRELVIGMATENRHWGYERIEGELRKVGHRVARTTVANILREHGIEPAPLRSKRTTWREFLEMQWGSVAAMDFFAVEAWTTRGLTRFHVLFAIDLATRRVEIIGVTDRPNGRWVCNALRRQLDGFDGFLRQHTHLIHDRDPLFTTAMADMLGARNMQPVKLPPRSPNLNAFAEHFVRSIKHECLNRIIPIGERHLRSAIDVYVDHYNRERPHQGLGNELLTPSSESATDDGTVVCDDRLGGLIRSRRRAA